MCQAQPGAWPAGRLGRQEVCRLIKRNGLFFCQMRTRQVGQGEKKGAASARTFLPKRVFSLQVGQQVRSVCALLAGDPAASAITET